MPTPLTTSSERLPKKTRLLSLDALRGFDMFWIISGERIFHGIANAIQSKHALQLSMPETWLIGISNQLKHSARDAVFPVNKRLWTSSFVLCVQLLLLRFLYLRKLFLKL